LTVATLLIATPDQTALKEPSALGQDIFEHRV